MLHVKPAANTLPVGIRAIIYDIDNCVAPHSNDDITVAWDPFLAGHFNLPLEEATRQRRYYFENPPGCSLRGMAAHHSIPEAEREAWIDGIYADTGAASGRRFVARYTPTAREKQLYADIDALGITQMIVTQGHPSHYGPITEHLGLAPFATHRIDRTSPPYEKLEAQVWHRALHLLGVPAETVLVFEDSPRNLIHPAVLGMHTVLIGDRDPGPAVSSIHHRFAAVHHTLELLVAQPR